MCAYSGRRSDERHIIIIIETRSVNYSLITCSSHGTSVACTGSRGYERRGVFPAEARRPRHLVHEVNAHVWRYRYIHTVQVHTCIHTCTCVRTVLWVLSIECRTVRHDGYTTPQRGPRPRVVVSVAPKVRGTSTTTSGARRRGRPTAATRHAPTTPRRPPCSVTY